MLPVVSVMKRDLLEGGYIQADETPVSVQSKESKAATIRAMSSNTAVRVVRSSSTSE